MRRCAGPVLLFVVFAGVFALAPGTKSLTDIKLPVFTAGALVVASWALWMLAMRRVPARPLGSFASSCGAYLLFGALTAAWAAHPWIVEYVFVERLVMLSLALAVAVLLSDLVQWRWFAAGLAALGAAVALFAFYWHGLYPAWAILRSASGQPVPFPELKAFILRNLHDVKAPLGNANLLAAVLVVSGFFAAGFALREWRLARRREVFVLLAVWALLVLPILYFCRAYSYYLAIVVAAVVLYALFSRRPATVVSIALIVGALLSIVVVQWGCLDRVRQTRGYLVRDSLWYRANGMFLERPVFGWGAGNYFTDNQPFAGARALDEVTFYEGIYKNEMPRYRVSAAADAFTHNQYLQELSEGGVVGLFVYLAFLVVPLAAAWSALRRGFPEPEILSAAMAAWCAILFANFFNCEIHFEFGPLFYMLAGFLVAARVSTWPVPTGVRVSPLAVAVAGLFSILALLAVDRFSLREYRASRESRRAQVLVDTRDHRSAVDLYLSAADLTWRPLTRARNLYSAAVVLSSAAGPDAAYGALETISSEVAAFLDTDQRMGAVLQQSGLYDKALFYYRRGLAGHPEYEDTRARLALTGALAALASGRVEEGLQRGRDYLFDNPDDRAGRRAIVRQALAPQTRLRAELDIQSAELLDGAPSAEDLVLAGTIHFMKGNVGPALPLLEKAMALGYKGRDGYYFLASAYLELGRREDAKKVVAEGLTLHPQCRSMNHLAKLLGVSAPPAAPPAGAP